MRREPRAYLWDVRKAADALLEFKLDRPPDRLGDPFSPMFRLCVGVWRICWKPWDLAIQQGRIGTSDEGWSLSLLIWGPARRDGGSPCFLEKS